MSNLISVTRLKQKLSTVLKSNQNNNLKEFILKSVAGTFGMSVASAGLGYMITLLLARFLGAKGYGAYTYALTLIGLIKLPALLGLSPLLIRELAILKTNESWNVSSGLLHWSNRIVILSSTILSLVAVYLTWQFPSVFPSNAMTVFWIGTLALPLMTLGQIRQAAMQAFGYIIKAQLPIVVVRPLFLIFLFIGAYLILGKQFTATWAMGMYVLANGIALGLLMVYFNQTLPRKIKTAAPKYECWQWIQGALPMLLLDGMYLISTQTDTIMLGMLKNTTEVGIYSLAGRVASINSLILFAFNVSLGPTFANLYAANDLNKLQKIITKSCQIILFSKLPISLGLIIFGNWFLLMFGSEFINSTSTLNILCIAQIFNSFVGPVGVLLNMTRNQNYTAIGLAATTILNIILNSLLIPQWGAEGAAFATVTSTFICNVGLAFIVYNKLGINSTPFPFAKL